jgi:ribonucleotide reductase alpha subunit
MKFPIKERFKLTEGFVEKYKSQKPNFGFNGLGEFVYMRTYSRIKEDGKNETWWETVRRVVEGIYSIQKQHIEDYRLGWNQSKAQKSAQEMYDRIFNFKMLGSGRSLWAMGSSVIMEKGLTEALYNCCFISTATIKSDDIADPFVNAMDFLMLGVGVGFDTRGAKSNIIIKEQKEKQETYIISDTREGWIESVKLLINSYFGGNNYSFDYGEIRPAGTPIKTFGGVSGGYKPLEELHLTINAVLGKNVGKPISETVIADIINAIGVAVVSGNVRRSAELLLGETSEDFMSLKDYEKNPHRQKFGWASNNSVIGEKGMDYSQIAKKLSTNGEPGILWMDNMQEYGRMRDTERNNRDRRVMGTNPCGEITLEDRELCNLVELIPSNHVDLEDFKKTIKYAYLFAKTVTLLNTSWAETNRVMLRNRRIGLSITGIVQFIEKEGLNSLKQWMETGYQTAKQYDEIYSEWFAVPESIKITTIKPSGTLSLLAGVTAGIHFPESRHYIRRVRVAKNSPYVQILKKAKYKVEPADEDPENTLVVEFPVSLGSDIRTINETNMWEQLNLASFAQEHWSDNSVSVTVTFKQHERDQIQTALEMFQFKLKSVSFLPKLENDTPYKQMPYEEVTKDEYEKMSRKILPLDFSEMISADSKPEMYCEADYCAII